MLRAPYTILMPPPNVTGVLHIGHALTFSLQDILARTMRSRGQEVVWRAGTDHAGIATQFVVERELAKRGIHRSSLSREELVSEIWKWVGKSKSSIISQMTALNVSADLSSPLFTMDPLPSQAVTDTFVTLFDRGLIYRDKRLVHWDVKLQTALSDLEVDIKMIKAPFYTIDYPIVGAQGHHISVATTRPETLFGDTAVAVNPRDARWAHLVGRAAEIPICGRHVPIIADDAVDPSVGTGALKVTPAHDLNDFLIGRRHGLPFASVISKFGKMTLPSHPSLDGLSVDKARDAVVSELMSRGFVKAVDPREAPAPHGDRSGSLLQPLLTDQWFVNMTHAADLATRAVTSGQVRLFPPNCENSFFSWLENIQPWCISRQISWGHPVPVWYAPDGSPIAARSEAEAMARAEKKFGRGGVDLRRDEDVLDTWFSSALWPLTTLGWGGVSFPDGGPAGAGVRFAREMLPGDVLVTGFDILFFWVARMMMMTLLTEGVVPFKSVYVHALVRDATGQKMSKSKSNTVAPEAVIEKFGPDALRLALAAMAAPGRDVRAAEGGFVAARNFLTKVNNAVKFAVLQGCFFESQDDFRVDAPSRSIFRWLFAKTRRCVARVDRSVATFRFDEAVSAVQNFLWREFCDAFVELSKHTFWDGEAKRSVALCLRAFLIALHPYAPSATDLLWSKIHPSPSNSMPLSATIQEPFWREGAPLFLEQEAAVDALFAAAGVVRSLRVAMGEGWDARPRVFVDTEDPAIRRAVEEEGGGASWAGFFRASEVKIKNKGEDVAGVALPVGRGLRVVVDFGRGGGVFDPTAAIARLEKELEAKRSDVAAIEGVMGVQSFRAKASEEVVAEKGRQLQEALEALRFVETILAELKK